MKFMNRFFLLLALLMTAVSATAQVVPYAQSTAKVSDREQIKAAYGVIERTATGRSNEFLLEITTHQNNREDWYEIGTAPDGRVLISGNRALSLTAGFYDYLKEETGSFVGQIGTRIEIPAKLPTPAPRRVESLFDIRNAYNYCTFSYTMAWWDWDRWEREIDLLALYGINQPLMIVGLEKVWQNMLRELNFSQQDISDFIPSTAYTAWWLMGNLEGTGGPVPQPTIDGEYQLALKILNRMRSLGMQPVSQSFFGMVPSTFKNYYPDAKVIAQGKWGSFKRPEVLAPTDPAFKEIAEVWYRNLHELYGKFDYYGGDLFHEGGITAGLNIRRCASRVEQARQLAAPGSVYVLQSWHDNPKPKLLRGLSKELTLIQKLRFRMSDSSREFGRTYRDKDWTLNLINNFGGGHGLYGNLTTLASLPRMLDRSATPDVRGLGYLCEGTETNPVVYDLLAEVFWSRETVDLEAWLADYTTRRYGVQSAAAVEAWKLLAGSIYNVDTRAEGQTDSIIAARPAPLVKKARSWSSGDYYWNSQDVEKAARLLLSDADRLGSIPGYRYDLTDLFRQILQDEAQQAGDNPELMRELIEDMDELTGSNRHFLLGSWIDAAQAKVDEPKLKRQYEIAARQLVTRWEPKEQYWSGIKDYSNRSWNGLIGDYYGQRWDLYFNYKGSDFKGAVTETENRWIYEDNTDYPASPEGDTVAICRELGSRWIN